MVKPYEVQNILVYGWLEMKYLEAQMNVLGFWHQQVDQIFRLHQYHTVATPE